MYQYVGVTCYEMLAPAPAAVEVGVHSSCGLTTLGCTQVYSGVRTYTEVITARKSTSRGCPNMRSDLLKFKIKSSV